MQDQTIGSSAWTTLGILSCVGLVTVFGETMILPAILTMIKDFQISYETSAWIFSSYLIAGAVMTPVAGKLSDLYGKKRVLLIILGVYCVGVLAGGFANSIALMIVARATMGVGISIFPIAFGIIRETLPESRLAIGQTIFGSTFSGGAVVGILVGASIIQTFGWHFTFFAVFPFAVLLAFLIWAMVKGTPPQGPRAPPSGNGVPTGRPGASIDYKGILFLAATLIPFLAGITQLQNGASDLGGLLLVGGLFATSVTALPLLVIVERKAPIPLIDFALLRQGAMLASTLIIMLVGLCTFTVYQSIPILVSSPQPLGFGGNAITVASVQLPFFLVLLFGTVGTGFALNRIGNVRMTLAGTITSAVGFFALLAFHSSSSLVTVSLAIIALGLSLAFTGGFNVVLVSSPMALTGTVLGMTLMLNLVGQSLGPAIAATFQQLNQSSVSGVPGTYPTQEAYFLIFATAAVLSLGSVALSVYLSGKRQAPRALEGPSTIA
jgi:MFS family permease